MANGKIAYSRVTSSSVGIWVTDGATRSRVTEGIDSYPAWSPDGEGLSFAEAAASDEAGDIWVGRAEGTWRQLTRTKRDEYHPSWSPDGERIAFGGESKSGTIRVYVMNADGSGRRVLTADGAGSGEPNFSCTGRIVFSTARDGDMEVFVMEGDGTEQRNISNTPGFDANPAWSPDGRRIVFTSKRDGNEEIYVMNADGSHQRRLTRDPAADDDPYWSPDGKKIVFTSKRTGQYQLFLMNTDGTGQHRLTHDSALITQAAWQAVPP